MGRPSPCGTWRVRRTRASAAWLLPEVAFDMHFVGPQQSQTHPPSDEGPGKRLRPRPGRRRTALVEGGSRYGQLVAGDLHSRIGRDEFAPIVEIISTLLSGRLVSDTAAVPT